MWIVLPRLGFFSVVRKPEDVAARTLTVRARTRDDLVRLKRWAVDVGHGFWFKGVPLVSSPAADYPWRVRIDAAGWGEILDTLGALIDYSNVKEETFLALGRAREAVYHQIWETLMRLDDRTYAPGSLPMRMGPPKPRPKRTAPTNVERTDAESLLAWAEDEEKKKPPRI